VRGRLQWSGDDPALQRIWGCDEAANNLAKLQRRDLRGMFVEDKIDM
jgi:hypothetical protein